jgi:hypothetical protein
VLAHSQVLGGCVSDALAPIAGKLGKLIRLLASDRDGEVLAAVHAIKRALGAEKLDLHTLAEKIETPANGKKYTEADAIEIYQRGVQDGREAAERQGPVTFSTVGEPSWHDIACQCAAQSARLQPREKEFVEDMVRWTVHGGEPTEKQAKWLRAIYARMRR